VDAGRMQRDLRAAMQQVRKATEIISHLRTFGRAAPVSREPVDLSEVVDRALALMAEQFRLRQIALVRQPPVEPAIVLGNPIQLEQVLINLLTNARDAVAGTPRKTITVALRVTDEHVHLTVVDSGPGIPPGLE